MSRSRLLGRAAAWSVVSIALTTLVAPAAVSGASERDRGLRAELVQRSDGRGSFIAARGTAGVFFGTPPGHAATRPAGVSSHAPAESAAREWVDHFGPAFGVDDPSADLHPRDVAAAAAGTVVHFQQTRSGLPVVGGELSALLDGSNNLVSVIGHVSTGPFSTTPDGISADTAKTLAVRALAKGHQDAVGLSASEPVLSLLDRSVLGEADAAPPLPVWATTVTSADRHVRHDVYVDAAHGGIALDLDDNPQAGRLICTPNTKRIGDPTCDGPDVTPVKNPGSSTDLDVRRAYEFSGAVDSFYSQLLNRTSLYKRDMTLASTVHYCPLFSDPDDNACPYDNAFWDGREVVFGNTYTRALDVVGHEMTHGVTEFTSRLFTYYQSGSINESQSDVMGELIQQIEGPALNTSPTQKDVYDPAQSWVVGEDLTGGPLRSMRDPTSDNPATKSTPADPDPDRMTSPYYHASQDDDGEVHANAGVGDKAAFLIANGADSADHMFNGYLITGVSGDGVTTTDPYGAGVTEDTVVKDVKTANIYYLLNRLMVDATTYADLYRLLPQACDALVGADHPLPMPAGWSISSTTLTSGDCDQVRLAVKATKMDVQPSKAGAAIAPPSPYCTNGGSPTSRRTDAFETSPFSAGTYVRSRSKAISSVYDYRSYEAGAWWWTKDYQQAGSTASLWGEDVDPAAVSPDPSRPVFSYEDARVQKKRAVHPAVGSYVRFRTVWGFESTTVRGTRYNLDGGVVEYSVNGGDTWHDAGSLFVNNGYNGRITNTSGSGYVDPNPLKGRRGFVQSSHGWTASRLDLSSLHGKSVLLRWRIGADEAVGDLGWFVDNVQTYSCNPTHVSIGAPTRVASGRSARVHAHLVRTGTTTVLPGLPVTLWEKRHSASRWTLVGTHVTNKYGNVRWWRTHSVAYDYQVRMPGKKPFAPSNRARATVRIG